MTEIDPVKAIEAALDGRHEIDTYVLPGGKRVHLIGERCLVDLAATEGHPASVIDIGFRVQALTIAHLVANGAGLEVKVHDVPPPVDVEVASLKLATMGLSIDKPTKAQEKYPASRQEGT